MVKVLAGSLTVTIIIVVSYMTGHKAGSNEQQVEYVEVRDKELQQRVFELQSKLTVTLDDKKYWQSEADRLSELKPEITYEITHPIVVNKYCTHRGSSYVKLWNEFDDRFRESSCRTDREGDSNCGEAIRF